MRTLTFIIAMLLPSTAYAGPLMDAIRCATMGPVASAIAARQEPKIHPVAKVQPEEECTDGNCPVDQTRGRANTKRFFKRR